MHPVFKAVAVGSLVGAIALVAENARGHSKTSAGLTGSRPVGVPPVADSLNVDMAGRTYAVEKAASVAAPTLAARTVDEEHTVDLVPKAALPTPNADTLDGRHSPNFAPMSALAWRLAAGHQSQSYPSPPTR
jgi:hypothetical protein